MPPSHFRKFDLLGFLLYSQQHLSLTTELRNPHKKSGESIFQPGTAEWEVWTLPLSCALPLLLLIVSLRNYCRIQKIGAQKSFKKELAAESLRKSRSCRRCRQRRRRRCCWCRSRWGSSGSEKKSQRDGEGREGLKNGGPVENVGLIRGDRCTHIEWTCSLHHTKMTRHRLLLKGGTSAYCVWWK